MDSEMDENQLIGNKLEENRVRARYLEPSDLAYSYEFEIARTFLSSPAASSPRDINDIIELRQCFLLIDAVRDRLSIPDDEREELLKSANNAKNLSFKCFRHLMSKLSLDEVIRGIESAVYRDALFELVEASKSFSVIEQSELLEQLNMHYISIRSLAKRKGIVQFFDGMLKKYLMSNTKEGTELVIDCAAVNSQTGERYYLPRFDNQEIDDLFSSYCDCFDPHPDRLQIITKWRKGYGFDISPLTRAKAAKRLREVNSELLDSSVSSTIKQSLEMVISPDQKACKQAIRIDNGYRLSFSYEWLTSTLDEASVLTNLLYVFEIVNQYGEIASSKQNDNGSSLFGLLGIHAKDARPEDPGSRYQLMMSNGVIALYEHFLLEKNSSLEHCVEWFFNNYIEDEYEITGFRCDMPSPNWSYLEKCRSICSEIERVSKEYHIFAKYGTIDFDLYKFERHVPFNQIGSLCDRKYVYGAGKDYEIASHFLCSNQSPLFYVINDHGDAGSFAELILYEKVRESNYKPIYSDLLSWLKERALITVKDDIIQLSERGSAIVLLKKLGSIWRQLCDPETQETLDCLFQEGFVQFNCSLLSGQESEFFSFILNDQRFSNSLALRNKYAHGAPPLDDPNCSEYEQDYLALLHLMVCLVEKMNDELRVHFDRKPALEVVDWPLIGS